MADLDGVVRIGTKIDDSGFKKGMQNLGKTAEKNLDTTQKEIKTTEKGIDSLDDTAKSTKKDVDKFGDGLDDGAKAAKDFKNEIEKAGKSTSSFGDFLKADLIGGGIQSLVSGFMGAVEQSAEFTKSLSKLQINAETAGNSFDSIQDNFRDFVALTGQADSSAEALSNLLQTGFDDAAITQTVEALSGAVTKFPDTLNIESLADGLQETLATGEATGQFGELLDRLGIGADNFSAALANTTSEAERQQLVLETLSGAGLNDLYQKYSEANAATLEFNQAQADLNIALSNFVSGSLPLAATGLSTVADNALRLSEAFKTGGIEGFLNEAKTIVTEFASEVTAKAPEMLEAGKTIVQKMIEGFVTSIPQFSAKAPVVLQNFLDKITQNLPKVLSTGKELILQFALGVINNIPSFVAMLPKIITSFAAFFMENYPKIAKNGGEIIKAIILGIAGAIPDLLAEMPALLASLAGAIIAGMSTIIQVGYYIVKGLLEGIVGSTTWLLGKIKDWCGSILEGIMAFFGIHSPSTVMRDLVGKMLTKGLIIGIEAESKKVTQAVVKPIEQAKKEIKNIGLAKNFSDVMKQAQETARKEAQSYSDVGTIMIEALQQGVEDNKENAIATIDELINETIEAMEDEEQKEAARAAGDEIMQSYKEALEAGAQNAKDYISDSISKITNEFQAQYDDLLSKQQALEDTLGGTYLFEVEDGQVFVEDVQQSIDTLNAYGEALEQLKEKGASAALLEEVGRLDATEGLAVIENLLGMTDEDFQLLNEKWAEKQELAAEIAAAFYEDQMSELKEGFVNEMMTTLESVPDDVYDIGVDTVEGWIDGMNEKLPSLVAKAQELARQAISAMKSELGIASPSKEGIYIGEMMNAGVAKGIDDSAVVVKKSIENMGFFDTVKAMIPQMQSAVAATMASIAPMPAYAGGGVTRTESVQTINRNTVQTVEVVANGSGIFDIVQKEGKRRGNSLITGRGLA